MYKSKDNPLFPVYYYPYLMCLSVLDDLPGLPMSDQELLTCN